MEKPVMFRNRQNPMLVSPNTWRGWILVQRPEGKFQSIIFAPF